MRRLAFIVAIFLPCAALWSLGAPMAGAALQSLGFHAESAVFFKNADEKGAALYLAGRWDDAAAAFGDDPANAYNRGNALARARRYGEAIAAYDRALSIFPDDSDAAFNKALLAALIVEKDTAAAAKGGAANSAASRESRRHDMDHTDGDALGSGDGFVGDQEVSSKSGAPGNSKAGKLGAGDKQASESGQGQAKGAAGDSAGAGRSGGAQADFATTFKERDRRITRRMEARSVLPTVEWLSTLSDDPGRFLKLRILAERARRARDPAASNFGSDP